jgi:hypothetical protein
MNELLGLMGPLIIATLPYSIPIIITLVIVAIVLFFKYLFMFVFDIFKREKPMKHYDRRREL